MRETDDEGLCNNEKSGDVSFRAQAWLPHGADGPRQNTVRKFEGRAQGAKAPQAKTASINRAIALLRRGFNCDLFG